MHIYASQEKEGLDKKISPNFLSFLSRVSLDGPENAVAIGTSLRIHWSLVVDFLWVACLFSLYAGTAAPEVNESHYLAKAKHFWDPSFASRDLFIASSDAHWFFFATVGWLSHILSLPAAAWCGRILGWSFVAWGWCLFVRRVEPSYRFAGSMTAPLWIASLYWGQLSGEWIVGGCEAKVFAYAMSFVGLSEIMRNRWSRAWYWLGFAAAFHVLTGGWLTLAAMLSYGLLKLKSDGIKLEPLRQQWMGLAIGGSLSLLGLIPAVLLNRGVDAAASERGAMIYVFQRLPHHLSPLRFATERWISFAALVAITLAFAWCYQRSRRSKSQTERDEVRLVPLLAITGIVSAIAWIGVLIDVCLSSWATNWSASLLRFYWFRWNDVVWPTLLTILVFRIAKEAVGEAQKISLVPWVAILLIAVPGSLLIGSRYLENNRANLPPADRAALVLRTESAAMQKQVFEDWIDVCYWTRTNTPSDALFLTPRFQQTFKWYAHRAEIACWKDSPQDALGLIEWEKRLLEIFPKSAEGYGIPMSDDHLREMRRRYRMDYVILDRRIQKKPPLLPLLHSNDTYAVFQFP
jgi:hypothetical protein